MGLEGPRYYYVWVNASRLELSLAVHMDTWLLLALY